MALRGRSAGAAAIVACLVTACEAATDPVGAPDASVDRVIATPTLGPPPAPSPADACAPPVVASPAVAPGTHVPEATAIAYASNPPSSGAHYPIWANFREYDHPVADGYLVHSMEHGAVVLFYKSDPAIAAVLRAVRDGVATDPACAPELRVRVIIVPRPELDAPIAAAAWGHTYVASCVDVPSLSQFVRDHYARAPENFCFPGKDL